MPDEAIAAQTSAGSLEARAKTIVGQSALPQTQRKRRIP